MVGTLYNTIAVAIGASAGLAMGARWSSALKNKVFAILGLFTLAIGGMMTIETNAPIDLFLALTLGTLTGHGLRLQTRLEQWSSANKNSGSEASATKGFMESMMLFCLGSMTLVGCMEDGLLNKPNLLIIKGTMDLISSAFLAATLGRGVLWSAAGVFLFQGALTVGFILVGQHLDPSLIQELSALGGVLMLGIGFQLLGLRPNDQSWPLVDALPSLAMLPLIHGLHQLLLT